METEFNNMRSLKISQCQKEHVERIQLFLLYCVLRQLLFPAKQLNKTSVHLCLAMFSVSYSYICLVPLFLASFINFLYLGWSQRECIEALGLSQFSYFF